MRRFIVVSAALLALAGCGQQGVARSGASPDPSPSPAGPASGSPSAADAAAASPWLLRFDSYVGEDGEARRATYLRVVPGTGTTTVVRMPVVQPMQAGGGSVSLLVDAGHRWALADSRPSAKERARGVVSLHDLAADGRTRSLDVARLAGADVRPDWVSFDPGVPNLLRVVSGQAVWKVDVASGRAEEESTLPQRTGWIFGGGFAKNTGQPYIEDTGSFATEPAGNGDDDSTPVERSGGQVLDPQVDAPYGDAPSPCEVSAGFVAKDGATWAFCVAGRTLQTKVLDPGASTWRDVGAATGEVVPADADPVFVLPPSA